MTESGSGWYGDSERSAKAGKPGEQVARKLGPEFYEDMGSHSQGAKPEKFENDKEMASKAGREGGKNSH